MPLTRDKIDAIATLASLPDEVKQTIETLANNTLQVDIDAKTSEYHSRYDADILEITGLQKPAGVKTYEFNKTVLQQLKTKAAEADKAGTYKQEIEQLKAANQALEDKVKAGATDPTLVSQIDDLKGKLSTKTKELSDLQKMYQDDKTALEQRIQQKEQEAKGILLDRELTAASAGLKLDPSLKPEIAAEIMKARKAALLAEVDADLVDDVLIFKDKKTGQTLRNPVNAGNPYTASELLADRFKDILDTGTPSGGGAGGKGAAGSRVDPLSVQAVKAAKSKMEAIELARKYVSETHGLTNLDPSFQDKVNEVMKEANLPRDLPLRGAE